MEGTEDNDMVGGRVEGTDNDDLVGGRVEGTDNDDLVDGFIEKKKRRVEGTEDLVDGFSERLSLEHTPIESILDIVREVVVGLDDGATTRSSNPRHHVYWKVSVLTQHADIAGDPLARRLRARALSRRGVSIPPGGAESSGNNLGELVCQESQLVTTCVQFVPGWTDADGMAPYMAVGIIDRSRRVL